jgi:ubiquinone/menaquinone biosynthesis C-methylase UbiE
MNEISPFDSLFLVYDRWFEEEGKLIFQIESQAFEKILPDLPRPWVEVGVGSGRFARVLGVNYGLDPALNMLKLARERGIKILQARGERIPFRPGTLGTVFLIVTLCFIDRVDEVLNETRRILGSRGRLVLGLVLRESPWGQFYRRKAEEGHSFYKFAKFYGMEELRGLLGQVGFRIDRIISTLFQAPGRVNGPEPAREGYSAGAGFTVILADKYEEK